MSNPADVFALLAGCLSELHEHPVSYEWVFGPAARGELRPGSDIDSLASVPLPVSLLEFAPLRRRLKELRRGASIWSRARR